MERTYSAQEITILITGLRLLVERERSLLGMVDATGRRQVRYFIKKYQKLIDKLHCEV